MKICNLYFYLLLMSIFFKVNVGLAQAPTPFPCSSIGYISKATNTKTDANVNFYTYDL